MKSLIMTLNSKYIHSNLAIHSLHQYHVQKSGQNQDLTLKEYTINHDMNSILIDIYRGGYDVVFASCYIWNIQEMMGLLENLWKVQPNIQIFLGGPEVSFNPRDYLDQYDLVKGVLFGEGERIFSNVMSGLTGQDPSTPLDMTFLKDVKGLAYRQGDEILINPPEDPINPLDEIPFPYDGLEAFENRILYYESTRGCPFKCSYCLSSACGAVRFLSIDRVKRDLTYFIERKVPQVKFIDRTFNVRKDHALNILKFIHENDNGVTNFHFEITADLLDEDYFKLIKDMREGLIQFEIGIQSTNSDTLTAINRQMDQDKIFHHVKRLIEIKNAHIHVDLIAGLPYEPLKVFYNSFDQVYALGAHQVQLGFLKVLKGTQIESQLDLFNYKVRKEAPFEVLENMWISFEEMSILKEIEDLVERFYNSGKYVNTLNYLFKVLDLKPHAFYLDLRDFYKAGAYDQQPLGTAAAYDFLMAYGLSRNLNGPLLGDLLKFDFYFANMKGQRGFFDFPDIPRFNQLRIEFLNDRSKDLFKHGGYLGKSAKEILKTVNFVAFKYDIITLIESHFEVVDQVDSVVLFDYYKVAGQIEKSEIYKVEFILERDL